MIDGLDLGALVALALGLLATGALAGVIAGLLGVGGGIVVVPVLYHLFGALGADEAVRMHAAVGTSLATVLATSFASARRHWAKGAVDRDLLRSWGPAIAVGVILGAFLGLNASGGALTALFAVVALAVALDMSFRKNMGALGATLPGRPWREGLGLSIGGISVMMGIGGGTLSVPILQAFSYPIRKAVGTAAAIGLVIAVPGVIAAIALGQAVPGRPPFSWGYVNLVGFALIVPTSTLTAPFGADLAHKIAPALLRKVFALFLFATSARMIVDVLG